MSVSLKNSSSQQTIKTIYILATLAVIFTLVATILIVVGDYRARENIARQQLDNLVIAYHDNTHLIMSNIDGVLTAMENTLMLNPSTEELNAFLETQGMLAPMVRTLLVVDADGIVVVDSRKDSATVGIDVSDRNYFTAYDETIFHGLYIDNPVESRLNGDWIMPISMGMYDENNNVQWVVVAVVEPRFFTNLNFSSADDGVIRGFIVNNQERVLANVPFSSDSINAPISDIEGLASTILAPEHHAILRSDDNTFFTASIEIEPYGLIAVFQYDKSIAFAPFYRDVALASALVIIIIGGIVLLARQQLRLMHEMTLQITAREQSEADYRRIVETALEGIWEIDDNNITTLVNPRMAEILGYSAEEMIGQSPTRFLFAEDVEIFHNRIRSRRQGELQTFESRYRHKNGQAVWLRGTATPTLDKNQQYIGSFGLFTDITQQKFATDELQTNQQKLQALFNSVGDALLLVDDNGNYIDANPAACEMFGYSHDEFLKLRVQHLTTSDTKNYLERWKRFKEMGRQQGTYTLYHKNGNPVIAEGHGVAHILPGIHLTVLRDVTERQQMERELQESEARFRKIADNTPTFIWVAEADQRLSYANKAWIDFTGQSPEAALGLGWLECVHPDHKDIMSRPFAEHPQQQKRLDLTARFLRHDGVYRWIRMRGIVRYNNDGQFTGYIGSSVDITEQLEFTEELAYQIREATLDLEEANEKLRASENRYRTLAEMSNAYSYAYRILPDGSIETEWITDGFTRISGYTQQEIAEYGEEFIFAESLEEIQQLRKRLAEKPTQETLEYKMTCKWGEVKHMMVHVKSFWSIDEKRVVRVIGTAQDITRRKQAEDALLAEHNFLQNVMNTNPGGIVVIDTNDKITMANLQAQKLLGLEYDKTLGGYKNSPGWQIITVDGDPMSREESPFAQVKNSKEPVYGVESAIRTPQGKTILLSVNGRPQFDEDGDFELAIFNIEDITLRMRWQQQLQEAFEQEKELHNLKHRFVTLISHELRTPMSIIMTSSEILQRSHQKMTSEQIINRTSRIQKQIMRLKRMMEDISFINKADMKGHEINFTTLDISVFCQQILNEVLLVEEKNLSVEIHHNGEANEIVTDETLFYQIVNNLITNAIKYTEEGGTVSISCHNQDDKIIVQVKDSGIGIPEEDQSQLFQSFHRASNVSNIPGTGLGLDIVKRAVDALKGDISFESVENVGTTFTVTLPTSADEPTVTSKIDS